MCTLFVKGVIYYMGPSDSPSETLQSLPVSVAQTMSFAEMQTKAANDY